MAGKPLEHAVKGPNCRHGPFEMQAFEKFFAHLQPWEVQFCPICGDRSCQKRKLVNCDPFSGERDLSIPVDVALAPEVRPITVLGIRHPLALVTQVPERPKKRQRSLSIPDRPARKATCTLDAEGQPKKLKNPRKSRGQIITDEPTYCKLCRCQYGFGNTAAHENGKRHIQKVAERGRWLERKQRAKSSPSVTNGDGENVHNQLA